MPVIRAVRYHDISCGHRVVEHEGKCKNLHGHNYRVHFHCEADALDSLGRVIDFSVIKSSLCMWLEDNWDHRMLLWQADPLLTSLLDIDPSIVTVPFNPTAENIAAHLLTVVGPDVLPKEVVLVKVVVDETRKCSCEAAK
jgi:6-pyruvoyltetrahydropterin/6-carboxytetrahydropterin synthase